MSKKKKHKGKKKGSRRERKLIKLGLIKPKEVSLQKELKKPLEKDVEVSQERVEFEKELEEEKIEEKKEEKIEKKEDKEGFKNLYSQFKVILIAVAVCLTIVIVLWILDLNTHWSDNIHSLVRKIAPPWDWDNLF